MDNKKNPVGRPKAPIAEYYEKIKPYLRNWCSVNEACWEAKVPVSTITDYIRANTDFSAKIKNDQNVPIVMARKVWIKEIKDGNYTAAKDYLERKRKKEFSLRTEVEETNPSNKSLFLIVQKKWDYENIDKNGEEKIDDK